MDLSVIVPAYNEEARIRPALERIHAWCAAAGGSFEIIVVDDGSTDATARVVEDCRAGRPAVAVIRLPVNAGKGAAVRTGVLAARGDAILFSDADLSTPIEELERLRAAMREGNDIVIASRGLPGSRIAVPQPWHRRLPGRLFPWLVRLHVTRRFRDTQCGFKLFTREAARALFEHLLTPGFAFDVEILYRATRRGYRVAEVPVTWTNSRTSSLSLLRHGPAMFASLLVIRRSVR